jgi:phosphoribosylamine--glycine ligase
MKVLVIGTGGREHAIVWKLRQSPKVQTVYCAPGNAGIASLASIVPIKQSDISSLADFAKAESVDLTIVGPEQPLVQGIVDLFESRGLRIFGPSKNAAQLEGSKVFSKDFMTRHHIPTAKYKTFGTAEVTLAQEFIKSLHPPIVVKADGLAAGKGVIIAPNREEALLAVNDMMVSKAFGSAGEQVVVEEYLTGEEASLFVITDGERFVTLAAAQDHKRILDGDLGKNTGGMGAYAPTPLMTASVRERVIREIVEPTLDGMRAEKMPYTGCLYVGLMLTEAGPRVLEYNCRFGDPEAQVVIPLIDGDFAELALEVAEGRLQPERVRQHPASAVCVVVSAQGYPDAYVSGKDILGLDNVLPEEGVVVFHAGTALVGSRIVTAGGRVLGVTAIGYSTDLEGTIRTAYRAVERITFDGAYYRSDIGAKALRPQTRKAFPTKEERTR